MPEVAVFTYLPVKRLPPPAQRSGGACAPALALVVAGAGAFNCAWRALGAGGFMPDCPAVARAAPAPAGARAFRAGARGETIEYRGFLVDYIIC